MSIFKTGDLVIDYEGDLVLVITDRDCQLAMVWLDTDGGPKVYGFIDTPEKFVEYHRKENYKYEVVGNVTKAFEKLRYELPK